MKRRLLSIASLLISAYSSQCQVTQINNNHSLEVIVPLTTTKAIVVSGLDSSIWVTDASLAGTVQLATPVKYEGFGQLLSGKFIFKGSTPATGSEVYSTDGTAVGTVLVADINPGSSSSEPGPMALLGGFLYFAATRPAEGRELWRTNGTPAGTTLVKDIEPGAASSFDTSPFNTSLITSNGTFLLFAANTTGSGNELWKSDGSGAGTVLLKEINTGHSNADSSNPSNFYPVNGKIMFTATDATHGEEIWTTDGSTVGTTLLKDINPGTDSSTYTKISFGPISIAIPIFTGFHTFNNHVFFQANDGTSAGELWSTDGTGPNTILIKNIVPTTSLSFVFASDAVNLSNKFIFPVSDADGGTRAELWESDGTPTGTVLFKAFTPVVAGDLPVMLIPFNADFFSGSFTQPLFQGNKFFFSARTPTQGNELWISDGTSLGTSVVKDINPGGGDGIDLSGNFSYLYTSTLLFFAANDGTHGNELWKTDGTGANTSMVFDINPNANDADPGLSFIFNNKIIFTATDGDDPTARDLFTVDGSFTPLPVKLTDFTVTLRTSDALLAWSTAQELNTKNFTIQRSFDAQHFDNIGTVQASGTTSNRHAYSFIDVGIINSGKSIVYYRLIATDKDGKSENSNIISLKLGGNSHWDVRLLTNPVQDNVNVILSGTDGKVLLAIQDMSGKTVYAQSLQNINGQVSLPVVLQKGVYILKAAANNELKTVKFVR